MLILFVPIFLLMGLFGGLGPTLVTTATAALLTTIFLLPPRGELHIESSHDILQLLVLVVSGVLTAAIGLIHRRLRLRAIEAQQRAEALYLSEQSLERRLHMAELGARVGIWEFDPITTAIWMTPECEKLYGVEPGTLTDRTRWRERIHPDDMSLVDTQMESAMLGEPIDVEFRVCWPDGNVRWLYARGSAERDASGAIVKFSGIDHDITERKHLESVLRNNERRLLLAQEGAQMGFWELDISNGNLYWSRHCEKLYGVASGSIRNNDDWFRLVHADDRPLIEAQWELIHRHEAFEVEFRIRQPSGEMRWLASKGQAIYDEAGRPLRLYGMNQDITDRKLTEEALRAREEMLSESQRIARVGSWRWELAGPIVWTEETYRIYGVNPETFTPTIDSLLELVHPDDRLMLKNWIAGCAEGTVAPDYLFRAVRPDGAIRYLTGRGETFFNKDGSPWFMAGTVQDITERVQLEMALKDSEQEFRLLAEAMPQIVWATRADGWTTYLNQHWVDYTGQSLEESYGHGWNKPFHPEDQQRAWDAWQNAVEQHTRYTLECRLRRFDGSYRWWLIRGVPVVGDDDKILKWLGTCTDINEIKLREEQVKASEQSRQFALEILHAGEWELNLNSHKAVRSILHDQIFGYDALLPEWTYEMFRQHVLLEDRAFVDRLFRQAVQEHSSWNFECRIRRIDGATRWIYACGEHRTNTAGEPTLAGIVMDITERKTATEELERSRLLMAEGERIAGLGTWEYEVASQNTVWSAEEFRIYGLEANDLSPVYQNLLRECIHPDDAERLDRLFREALAHAAPFDIEHKIVRPDGTVRYVQDLAYPYFDASGQLIKYVGTTLDITERKQAVGALADREARLNLALDAAHAGSWEWNLESGDNYWSTQTWELYGLVPGQCPPSYQTWEKTVYVDDLEYVKASVAAAVEECREFEIQWRVNLPQADSERWLMARGRPINAGDGKPERYIGIVIDISESKRAAAEIKLWADAFQNCAHGIAIGDPATNSVRACNPAFANTLGCTTEQIEGRPIHEIYASSARSALSGYIAHADAHGQVRYESVMRRQDGSTIDVQMDVVSVRDDKGIPIYRVATMQDISERKQAQKALSESEERLRLFIEHAPASLAMFDRDMRYLAVSYRWLTDYGLRDSDILGVSHYEIFPEIPERWKALHRRGLGGEVLRMGEDSFVRADGIVQWLRWEIRPWIAIDGSIGGIVIFSEDISQRKQAEEELHASERRFHDIAEVSADWIWEVDAQGRYTFVSAGVEDHLGYKPEELLGKTPFDLMLPDEAIRVKQTFAQIAAQYLPFRDLENINVDKNGSLRYVLTNGVPIQDAQGQLLGYRGLDKDITERKRNDELLRASETRLRAILEGAQDGIMMAEAETKRLIAANRAICTMLGYRQDELLEMTVADLHREADLDRVMDTFERMAKGEIVVGEDIPMQRKNGSVFPVDISVSRMEIDGVRYLAGFFRDITARKQAEQELEAHRDHLEELIVQRTQELRESQKRLELIIENLPAMFFIKDENGQHLLVNRKFEEAVGIGRENVLGHTDLDIFPKATAETMMRTDRQIILDQTPLSFEEQLPHPDGDEHVYLVTKVPLVDERGKLYGLFGISTDVTSLKLLQNELRSAKEKAEEATLAKSAFLANMSHEIRTPMNAVLGFCHLLKQRALDREARDLVEKIHRAGQSLLDLINDILDFSKIESGKLEIENVPFSLYELLDDIGSVITNAIGHKNLELVIVPGFQSDALVGDKPHLRQILVNLLGNAVKFAERGHVVLRIEEITGNDNRIHLRFSVRDSGIGISSEQQQQIFSAFSQADPSISRRFGGTGLGLSISKRLVQLMGGELQVSSELNRGSEFFFTLPFQRYDSGKFALQEHSSLHLLVADDCAATREGLVITAKSLGWDAEAVDSGEAAMARLSSSMDGATPYDAVLLDWEMPGLDGLATVQAIRKACNDPIAGEPQPLIIAMITTQSSTTLPAQPDMATVDALLSKPLTPSSLYNTVVLLLNERSKDLSTSRKPVSVQPGDKRLSGVRILVVDDSEINLEVASTILASEGALIHTSADGQEAVDWLHANGNSVDIVLMDIQMPNLDGYAATRIIREDPRFRTLPIIALTAGVFQPLRDAAGDAGMNDFIAKPFNVDEMIALIRRWIGYQAQSALTGTGNTDDPAHHPAPWNGHASAPKVLPDLDWPSGLKLWREASNYQMYLNKFRESYCDAGQTIAAHCSQGNLVAAAALAHKLKGTAATLALPRVAELASRLEQVLTAGQPASERATAELQATLEAACAAITSLDSHATPPKTITAKPAVTDHNVRELAQPFEELLRALGDYDLEAAESAVGALEERLHSPRLAEIKAWLADFDYSKAEALVKALMIELNVPKCD